jgi:predicted PurR-regulated permease PerM
MQQSTENKRLSSAVKYFEIGIFSIALLYFGKTLFIPLLFGLLISLISYPICRKLEKKHWPRSLSIAIVLFFVIILFFLLVALLGYELNMFLKDIPGISEKLKSYAPRMQSWLRENTGIQQNTQSDWLDKIIINMENDLTRSLRTFFNATVSTSFMLVMIPVYASLFLYQRETFLKFLESVFSASVHQQLHNVIRQSIRIYFRFVKGTFFVYLIVGVLNSTGLWMLGIKHAFLYGMLTAFMTIIPYIGIIISASMPVAVALLTKDSLWYPIAVILLFTFVQYLEANVIFPKVVGEQLNLSTWATLVGIIAGTILWGVAGMILFVPLLAILKIVSDQVEVLKPLNILLNRKHGYGSGG